MYGCKACRASFGSSGLSASISISTGAKKNWLLKRTCSEHFFITDLIKN